LAVAIELEDVCGFDLPKRRDSFWLAGWAKALAAEQTADIAMK
jgi:ribosome modulation factor